MILITGTRTQVYECNKCVGESIRGIMQLDETEVVLMAQNGKVPVMHPFVELRGGYVRSTTHYEYDNKNQQLLVEIEDKKVDHRAMEFGADFVVLGSYQ